MPIRLRPLALLLALAAAPGACAPPARVAAPAPAPASADEWLADRLYFGRDIPGGGTVSEAQWAEFLRDVVTPHFPSGLTVWRGEGQWRDATGTVIREATFILERLHPPGAEADAALRMIADEYKRRFGQESVLHVRAPARVQFLEEE